MDLEKIIEEIGKIANVGIKAWGTNPLSSTADVQLGPGLSAAAALLDFPSDAKTLIAVQPILTSPAGNTANEPIVASMTLSSKSTDMALGDCTFLAQPIGSSLLKSSAQVQGPIKDVLYPIFSKIPVGAKLKIVANGLFNHTIEPYVGMNLWITDLPLEKIGIPQHHWITGTFTNTGTGAAEVTGSKISFSGGRRIVEVGGFAVGTTVAALKGLLSKCRLNSPDLLAFGDMEFFLNPASGQVDTNIQECIAGVARHKCSIPVKSPANLNDKHTLEVAVTTTGNFVIQVGYI